MYYNDIVRMQERKKERKKRKRQLNSTDFNHLLNLSCINDFINPISLGIEPLSTFSSGVFGDKILRKSIFDVVG